MEKSCFFIANISRDYYLHGPNSFEHNDDQNALHSFKTNIISEPYEILAKSWSYGTIPSWHGNLPELEVIVLNNNSFSGKIPFSLGNSSKIWIIDSGYNLLDGIIPQGIGNLSSLEKLDLKYSKITGSIPYGVFNLSTIERFISQCKSWESWGQSESSVHIEVHMDSTKGLSIKFKLTGPSMNNPEPFSVGFSDAIMELFFVCLYGPRVPPNWRPRGDSEPLTASEFPADSENSRTHFCRKCNQLEPPQCHHCSVCGSFTRFSKLGLLHYSLLPDFIAFFGDGEISGTPGSLATTFLAFVLNLAFALNVMGFLIMHISLVASNTTTIESSI
ncbi:hypothetical protein BUALT_Bualt01G0009900 [Buddleja alternifolia]|uniref:Uncharacterized protein n=1 Tax=Buddleja alternifolia TaxID=168488 RepID=A0AAV6YE28_9LAMI|nr:hypothetical protein BUALT_Bualt01G0009900 [Buddleja alternifolia]